MKGIQGFREYLALLDPPDKWMRNPLTVDLKSIVSQFTEKVKSSSYIDLKACGIAVYNSAYLHRRRVDVVLSMYRPRREKRNGEAYAPQLDLALRRGMHPVSFDDLVRALHDALSELNPRRRRRRDEDVRKEVKFFLDEEEVRVEELIGDVYRALQRLSRREKPVRFRTLILNYEWDAIPVELVKLRLVRILLCLLHLTVQRKVELLQKETGEIQIYLLTEGWGDE